jgi:hypothetical protein
MDKNKLTALRKQKFKLKKVCMLCIHFNKGQNLWGTCRMHSYYHLKHKSERELSVHALGYCRHFMRNARLTPFGDSWEEFMEK